MSNIKFTPGPWSRYYVGPDDKQVIANNKECIVAELRKTKKVNEEIHNAHLIAAAPDMYELLENLGDHLKSCWGEKDNSWLDDIKTVLSKANPQPITEG